MEKIDVMKASFVFNDHQRKKHLEVTCQGKTYLYTSYDLFFRFKLPFFNRIFSMTLGYVVPQLRWRKIETTLIQEASTKKVHAFIRVHKFPKMEESEKDYLTLPLQDFMKSQQAFIHDQGSSFIEVQTIQLENVSGSSPIELASVMHI